MTLPISVKTNGWKMVAGVCPKVVTLYEVLETYFATKSFNLHIDTTLKGTGSISDKLGIAQQGALVGQVLTWNGTSWSPMSPPGSLQSLSLAGSILSLSGSNSVDLTPAFPPNQTLGILGRNLSISSNNSVTLPDDLQVISFSAPNINLSKSGGNVPLTSFISADSPNILDIGTDQKLKSSLSLSPRLSGNGDSTPLDIASMGAATGEVLKWNGTAWAPSVPTLVGDLDDLSDVVLSPPMSGQILYYNGTEWINWTPNFTVLPSAGTGDIIYWSGSNWVTATPRKVVIPVDSGNVVNSPHTPKANTITDVYLNGVLKENGTDYTQVGAIFNFVYNFKTNDKVTIKYFS